MGPDSDKISRRRQLPDGDDAAKKGHLCGRHRHGHTRTRGPAGSRLPAGSGETSSPRIHRDFVGFFSGQNQAG